MNIEDVRYYALGLGNVTEDMFAENWLSFRVGGKWFLLVWLESPEPRVAVKLPPEVGLELRERYSGVQPAYHMNKSHWNDLYLERLEDDFIREQIARSYRLVSDSLPKHGNRENEKGRT